MRKPPLRATASILTLVLVAITAGMVKADSQGSPAPADVAIKVLSNRADLISGGDALVEVVLPAGADHVAVDVDGRDVTSAFATRPDGRFTGLLTGLALGDNLITARAGDDKGASLTIANHPIGGSVFSGPMIQPWFCSAGALDADCNRAPTVTYQYMPEGDDAYATYDPANPPTDVATTTTDEGKTVPHIIRNEVGVLLRDGYRISVLFDPTKPVAPWAPPAGYNHKAVITHGASCDTSYTQGSAPAVTNPAILGRGFLVLSHALDNAGHNCNIVTQAESLLMTKERAIEQFGEIRYTIGSGCSGGALTQYQVANAYPGIYQAITPACSFPDAWGTTQYNDYWLMLEYFKTATKPVTNLQTPTNRPGWGTGVVWGQREMEAVLGHPNPANPLTFTTVIPDKAPSRTTCDVPATKPNDPNTQYNPSTNPGGARCTMADYMINMFGRRPQEQWTAPEKAIGRGFARRGWDNAGVQYGLKGMLSGKITTEHFVEINTKVGARDIDGVWQPQRESGDLSAVTNLYRSGAINMANNLDKVAIIDMRGPDPGVFHDVVRTYSLQARLEREHGHSDNMLLWRGTVPIFADTTMTDSSIIAADKWLAQVEADKRDIPLAQKIVEDRPADVTHRCTNGQGTDMPSQFCDAVVQSYSTPRQEAGMPMSDDIMKCTLTPIVKSLYPPNQFTADQWTRLKGAFPNGVCNYGVPGQGMQKTIPWMGYEGAYQGQYGGQPLGPPPVSRPFGID